MNAPPQAEGLLLMLSQPNQLGPRFPKKIKRIFRVARKRHAGLQVTDVQQNARESESLRATRRVVRVGKRRQFVGYDGMRFNGNTR